VIAALVIVVALLSAPFLVNLLADQGARRTPASRHGHAVPKHSARLP